MTRLQLLRRNFFLCLFRLVFYRLLILVSPFHAFATVLMCILPDDARRLLQVDWLTCFLSIFSPTWHFTHRCFAIVVLLFLLILYFQRNSYTTKARIRYGSNAGPASLHFAWSQTKLNSFCSATHMCWIFSSFFLPFRCPFLWLKFHLS